MSLINVINVTVLNNPTHFSSSFQFQIQFECLQDLPEDLDWKLTYVGNAETDDDDQVLEEISVGPNVKGVHMFVLQTPGPNHQMIKNKDLIGVTVILLTCSYLEQKFVQIGYYVNNEYAEPFEPEYYPDPVNISLLHRVILANEPRVTRYAIDWTGQAPSAPIEPGGSDELDAIAADMSADNGNDLMDADEDDDDISNNGEDDEDDDDDDDDNEGDIDLEAEDEADADRDDELDESGGTEDEAGPASLVRAPVPQIYINEDSMDVMSMQIEHNAHSNSYTGHFRDYI